MKIADAKTVRAIDAKAMRAFGIRGLVLMENAGRGVAEAVKRELCALGCVKGRVSIITGKGNNGGDGFVAARHLLNSGVRAQVFSLCRVDALKGDARANAEVWKRMGGRTVPILGAASLKRHSEELRRSCVVVDAVFGTGLATEVKGFYADVIGFINGLKRAVVVSVDVPSGIDASTGAVHGCAVKADVTATMAMPKTGLCQYPGRSYAGRVEVVDIGVPCSLVEDESIMWSLAEDADVSRVLVPRDADSHKGTYGHLVVIAGSPGKTGAAAMAGMGAMRVGTGLATIALPEGLNAVVEEKTIEVMTFPLPESNNGTLDSTSFPRLKALLRGKSAVVFGPGLGTGAGVFELLEMLVKETRLPMVIDADGLNCLAGRPEAVKKAKGGMVLTPHPGEMARLLGSSIAEVQADRIGSARSLSDRSGAVVVFKGAATVVAAPDGRVSINPTGNAGLATAGTGDVLAGMIGGLLAQGLAPFDAAVAAVYVHGRAADELRDANGGGAGMVATDLLAVIPGVMNALARKEP